MPNDSTLLDFTGIRYYDGYVQAWASGAFATKEELDEIRQQAARAYHFCGSVPTVADLPASANEGDVYNIGNSLDGDNYVWANVPEWTTLPAGADPMLAPYVYKGEVADVQSLPSEASVNDVWSIAGSDPVAYYVYSSVTWAVLPEGADPTKAPYVNKGEITTPQDLPSEASVNDVWSIAGADPAVYYACSKSTVGWDKLGATVDLSNYLTWDDIPTVVTDGVMTAKDKAKLDGIEPQATKVLVDAALNATSVNPVQNAIVTSELNRKLNKDELAAAMYVSKGAVVDSSVAGGSSVASVYVSGGSFVDPVAVPGGEWVTSLYMSGGAIVDPTAAGYTYVAAPSNAIYLSDGVPVDPTPSGYTYVAAPSNAIYLSGGVEVPSSVSGGSWTTSVYASGGVLVDSTVSGGSWGTSVWVSSGSIVEAPVSGGSWMTSVYVSGSDLVDPTPSGYTYVAAPSNAIYLSGGVEVPPSVSGGSWTTSVYASSRGSGKVLVDSTVSGGFWATSVYVSGGSIVDAPVSGGLWMTSVWVSSGSIVESPVVGCSLVAASNGAMSKEDKAKLDGIAVSATSFTLAPATSTRLGGVIVDPHVWSTYASDGEPSGDAQIPEALAGRHVVQNAAVYSVLASKVGTSDYASATHVSGGSVVASSVSGGYWVGTSVYVSNNRLVDTSVSGGSWVATPVYVLEGVITHSDVPNTSRVGGADGIIHASDYAKLQSIASGATVVHVDSALDSASTNPVENQAIYSELAKKAGVEDIDSTLYVTINGGTAAKPQVVSGAKTFTTPIVGNITGSGSGATLSGGTATKARQLVSKCAITVAGEASGRTPASAGFDGTADVTINISGIPTYSWNNSTGGKAGLVPPAGALTPGDYILQANGSYYLASSALGSTYVHLTGNGTDSGASAVETIYGVKRFEQSPLVGGVSAYSNYLGSAYNLPAISVFVASGGTSALMTPRPAGSSAGAVAGDVGLVVMDGASTYSLYSCNGSAWVATDKGVSSGGLYFAISGRNYSSGVAMSCYGVSGSNVTALAAGEAFGNLVGIGSAPNTFSGLYEYNGGIYDYHLIQTSESVTFSGNFYIGGVQRDDICSRAVNVGMLNQEIANAGRGALGGRVQVVNVNGNKHYVAVTPAYNVEALGFSLGSGVHPGFSAADGSVGAISIGQYAVQYIPAEEEEQGGETVVVKEAVGPACIPGVKPAAGLSIDALRSAAVVLGAYPVPNAAWAARALWAYKQRGGAGSAIFHGNTSSGGDALLQWQRGVEADIYGATFTGTGPIDWTDDGTPDGLADMAGNVWEYVAGARVVNGQIQVVEGLAELTESTIPESAWKAIATNGTLVAPGSPSTLHYGGEGASITIGTAAPSGALSGHFEAISIDAGVSSGAVDLLRQLCLAPVNAGQSGGFSMPAAGTAYLCRGGSYKTGAAGAGLFAMRFVAADATAEELADVGTRLAYK